jgi:hypothetical protein
VVVTATNIPIIAADAPTIDALKFNRITNTNAIPAKLHSKHKLLIIASA